MKAKINDAEYGVLSRLTDAYLRYASEIIEADSILISLAALLYFKLHAPDKMREGAEAEALLELETKLTKYDVQTGKDIYSSWF